MEITMIDTEKLIPYKNNPRDNSNAIDRVAESINQFGFKQPIVIDKNNVIVAGHTRVEASKKLEIKKIPCILADDLTDDQIKAYRLVDNKTSEFANWDFGKLEKELNEIDLTIIDSNFESLRNEIESVDYLDSDRLSGSNSDLLPLTPYDHINEHNEVRDNKYGTEKSDVYMPINQNEHTNVIKQNHTLRFGSVNVFMSDEENELLHERYKEYTGEHGISYGFVGSLIT